LTAANATFALKAGLWVRRARFAILSPDPRHLRRSQADFPLVGLSEFPRPPLCMKNTENAAMPMSAIR
jgi:hypothetical protein